MARRTTVLLAALAVLGSPHLAATPGSLLADSFPGFSSQGTVEATALADDGGVFLWGSFQDVDGVARPGLAKLDASGRLDAVFAPTVPPAGPRSTDQTIALFGAVGTSRPGLFALPAGEVMVLGRNWWELRKADGARDEDRYPELPRTDLPVPRPQLRTAERLYVVAGSDGDSELRAYLPATGERDPSFSIAGDLPEPPYEAAPAPGGTIWVLGRTPGAIVDLLGSYSSHTLYRLTADGSLDPAFAPRPLKSGYEYFLQAASDGGFRLLSHYLPRYRLWPVATSRAFTAETFDADGSSLGSVSFRLPFSMTLASVAFQGPERVLSPALDLSRIIRNDPGSYDPDPTFDLPLAGPNGSPTIPRSTRTLDQLADGRLLAGGTRRFLANGSPAPTWHQARLGKSAIVSHLLPLPDGSVIAGGDFDQAGGAAVPGLCRLGPEGARDPSFAPDLDGRFVMKVLPLRDGEFLALFATPVTDVAGERSPLVRLDSAGRLTGIWPPVTGPFPPISANESVTDVALLPDGSILLQTFSRNEVSQTRLNRYLPDGTPDPGFSAQVRYDLGASLFVLDDGTSFHNTTRYGADGAVLETVSLQTPARAVIQLADRSVLLAPLGLYFTGPALSRWHPDRGLDPEFVDPFLPGSPLGAFSHVTGVLPAARDKLLVWGSLHTAAGRQPLVRLHATGQLDPTFRLPRVPSPIEITAVHRPGDGSLWIAGDFSTLDGQPRPGLARLADSSADGYEEWIAAAAVHHAVPPAMLAPEADLDGDGASNYFEYAAASDPAFQDASRALPHQLGPLRWSAFCNPEAPELSRRIETSRDLATWIPARADEVRIESNAACLSWSLLPRHARLFARMRVE